LIGPSIDDIIDGLMQDGSTIFEVVTLSGTIYTINTFERTWKRMRADGAAYTRTDDGTYVGVHLEIGERMVLVCPPIVPGAAARIITSTPVLSIASQQT
jgi:hypothetical protein